MPDAPRFDLPMVDEESQPFWDAAHEGRLLIRRCNACEQWHYYPRPFCPHCWSQDVEWVEASGRAVLYTYSIVRRNDLPPFNERVPYVAAVVDLEEGPRMITELVDCPEEDIQIGMPLHVDFRPLTDTLSAPVFRRA